MSTVNGFSRVSALLMAVHLRASPFLACEFFATLSLSRSREHTLVNPSSEHLQYLYIATHHLHALS